MSNEEIEKVWNEDPNLKIMIGLQNGRALRGTYSNINGNLCYGGKINLFQVSAYLSVALEKDEKRMLIITDDFTKKYTPKIIDAFRFANIESKVWSGAQAELPLETIEEGRQACEEFKPRVLMAVGGGSVIDTGKAVMIKYEHPDVNFLNINPVYSLLGLRKKIKRFVAVPTTSGTGSEVTAVSVVTDTRRTPPMKIPIVNYETIPDMVILNTDFVKDMPPFLTMATGLDAFAHSMGAYVSNFSTPFTDAMNELAIKEIIKYLGRSIKYGSKDMEAKEKVQWAAYYAGLGFGNSQAGIDHAMGHSIGAIFHLHHGLAVGLFTPQSIAYQAKVTNKWKGLCPIFGVDPNKNVPREKLLKELLNSIKNYITFIGGIVAVKDCKNPVTDKESYISQLDILAKYADIDIDSLSSPRPVNANVYRKMFELAWEGKDLLI